MSLIGFICFLVSFLSGVFGKTFDENELNIDLNTFFGVYYLLVGLWLVGCLCYR